MRLRFVARAVVAVFVTLLLSTSVAAQTTIDNTVFTTAVSSTTANTVSISSATCTSCTFGSGTWLYVDQELMIVTGQYVSGTTNIPVLRGQRNTYPSFHTTTAVVWVGPPGRFRVTDPVPLGGGTNTGSIGACNKTQIGWYPWINISNGYRWLCDNGQNAVTAILWRAAVVFNFTANSDATGELRLPPGIEPPASFMARLEAAATALMRW